MRTQLIRELIHKLITNEYDTYPNRTQLKRYKPMKKQPSEKTSGLRANRANQGAYLSLNRQTYKPYLKSDDEDDLAEKEDQDLDRIVKFAY